MNKRRLGRGLEALLGREEGGFEGRLARGERADPDRRRSDRSQPVSSPAGSSTPARSPRWPTRSGSTACSSRSWSGPSAMRYQLIAGERRLRASIEAQLHEVPARVLDLDDQRVFELAMVENLQREDLNAIDKADGLPRIPRPLRRHPGRAGRPAGPRPLDRLQPDPAARAARRGPGRRARQRDHPGPRPRPARPARRREPASTPAAGSSPSTSRSARPRPWSAPAHPTPSRPRVRKDPGHSPDARPPHLLDLEQRLHQQLGTTVLIRRKNPDRGQIIIDYHSREEFDRLTALFFGAGEPASSAARSQLPEHRRLVID